MQKEWKGGPVDIEDNDWGLQRIFWRNHSAIVAKSFQRYFSMPVSANDFKLVDYKDDHFISNDSKRPQFFVNFLHKDQLQFSRSIYATDHLYDWNFPSKKEIFETYVDKLSLILLTFYNKIEIVYMGQVHFNRKLDNWINRFIVPKMNIFQDNIKIIGHEARYNFLSHNYNKSGRTDVVNLFGGREIQHIQKFINTINTQVIPSDLNIVISLDDDIEDIKRKLDLVVMYIY